MTPDNIDTEALRELEAKATPGPWRISDEGDGRHIYPMFWKGQRNTRDLALIATFSPWDGVSQDNRDAIMAEAKANAECIVALRNAAPSLLALAERAQEQAKEIEEVRQTSNAQSYALSMCREAMAETRSFIKESVAERDALKAEVETLKANAQNAARLAHEDRRKLSAADAEVERLRDLASELIEVADLRGDADLPHPCDDPKFWTARMQYAWDNLRAALPPSPEASRG